MPRTPFGMRGYDGMKDIGGVEEELNARRTVVFCRDRAFNALPLLRPPRPGNSPICPLGPAIPY
jgi:hypothetical protein